MADTLEIARRFGGTLRKNDVVALDGPLGAGKTVFVKGIAQAFGIPPAEVTSPTFTLVHEYGKKKKIYHMDWYRLKALNGQDQELALECFDAGGVSVIEWASKAKHLLPPRTFFVQIAHEGADSRLIEIALPKERK